MKKGNDRLPPKYSQEYIEQIKQDFAPVKELLDQLYKKHGEKLSRVDYCTKVFNLYEDNIHWHGTQLSIQFSDLDYIIPITDENLA